MDEQAFRERQQAMQQRRCVFAKAIFSACAGCALADRIQIAEREIVRCRDAASQARCAALHHRLRQSFGFAIGELHDDAPIPHAQEMRIQCGGLLGLGLLLNGTAQADNVDVLLAQVWQRWGGIGDIPYSGVVHAARLCYQGYQR